MESFGEFKKKNEPICKKTKITNKTWGKIKNVRNSGPLKQLKQCGVSPRIEQKTEYKAW